MGGGVPLFFIPFAYLFLGFGDHNLLKKGVLKDRGNFSCGIVRHLSGRHCGLALLVRRIDSFLISLGPLNPRRQTLICAKPIR